ncbi:GNAT family N-acetyltransferase [Mesobacillus zeae]|uniref:GNAT family N-acetyltransferase n=2 Tax=Mesobacillus zeae TaxID=1917180 RepID=A0A398B0Y4_9BACI|nr:GNAT family N-acetyltransferase [Mesobacillus zeae]RID83579.1 GNAT family N-acetyltransferase [Mesobacillus zeae]
MKKMIKISKEEDLIKSFEVMKELRTDLDLNSFLSLFGVMQKEGYELYALLKDTSIKALAGVSIKTNFYNKRHLFVHDLVTTSSARSSGYGYEMMNYLFQFAKEKECSYIALESGLQRVDAHRFYEDKLNFDKFCYSFRKEL